MRCYRDVAAYRPSPGLFRIPDAAGLEALWGFGI
jgi:hypothetical protein